jgi:thiocyanate hydrolase subunit beta
MTNIASECRSAHIVRDHAMILPDDATPKPDGIFGKDNETPAPLFRAYMHPPHDVGGQRDVPVYYEEKEEEQWELNTYVTCEVLGWRGIWTAEERRRRADNDLGYTLYLGVPYYGRWIWSAARMLVDKKHISLTELLEKIAEVKSRYGKK